MSSNIVYSVRDAIGNTPLLSLSTLSRLFSCGAAIYAKAEMFNPGGSIKDRTALAMVKNAIEKGMLGKDWTVITAAGGNSSVSLAMICASYGLTFVSVMPDNAATAKINAVKAYGGKVLAIPAARGAEGVKAAAQALRAKIGKALVIDPFESEEAIDAHRNCTAVEILDSLGEVDILVAGVGTGATITGCGEAIKRRNPECLIIAVEPSESPVLSGGMSSPHSISGIGAGFIPPLLNTYLLDEVIRVRSGDAAELCSIAASAEGLICGISSGAALAAAVNVACRPQNKGKKIVVILPDRGE